MSPERVPPVSRARVAPPERRARVAPPERRARVAPPEGRARRAPVPQALQLVSAAALVALAADESGSAPAPQPAEGLLAKKQHR
jgi:hypothetical protein